jgi:RNA polymerase sigma-70 factor (ECF subfamily)
MEIEKYIILSDAQLVVLALDGNSEAFETLFRRYREEIYGLCLQRTGGNREDASDLVQETFVKAWYKMDQLRGGKQSEKAWLSRIAINLCRDQQRTRWLRMVDKHAQPELLMPW